jgi:hypothetical protein
MRSLLSARPSSLCGSWFVFHCCAALALVPAEGSTQQPDEFPPALKTPADSVRAPNESNFLDAIQRVEELAQGLEAKTYRDHLQEALLRLGYSQYHPLFRTSLNGFERRQINLEDADEYKMGSFAFSLKSSGQVLNPDPFDDWLKVQSRLDTFERTMEGARNVAAHANILALNAAGNMSLEVFRKLSKRWHTAVSKATDAYEHALAVRAVLYSGGELRPAPETFRFVVDGGQYAVVCGFGVCNSPPATNKPAETPAPR